MKEAPTAYSLLIMHRDVIYAVRDPYGNRPLCIGRLIPVSDINDKGRDPHRAARAVSQSPGFMLEWLVLWLWPFFLIHLMFGWSHEILILEGTFHFGSSPVRLYRCATECMLWVPFLCAVCVLDVTTACVTVPECINWADYLVIDREKGIRNGRMGRVFRIL